MKNKLNTRSFLVLAACTTLAGCVSEDPNLEGVSLTGGNAIAHNSALQIIDPWPINVHDTDIVTQPTHEGDTTTASTTSGEPSAEPTPAPTIAAAD